jgi:hypothetical protein
VNRSYRSLSVCLLIPVLIAGAPDVTHGQELAPVAQGAAAPASADAKAQAIGAFTAALKRIGEKNKGDFNNNNDKIWSTLLNACGVVDQQCANAAIFAAGNECEASAKFFTKNATRWQTMSLVLVLTAATFIGFGASTATTFLKVQPKVWAALGGTTGLGAAGTEAKANATGDLAGVGAVSTILGQLATLLTPQPPAVAVNVNEVFLKARLFGAQCSSAANGSATNASAPTPSAPAGAGGS